ncbi:MAG: SIS domain-containing protein [Candidatus Gastranaerophilales bacterium]|nr:SIS domain-containing protein [Candidatus Gastranaerophilales bacterium]
MEKEIFQQVQIIRNLIKKYIKEDNVININLPDGIKKIALIASGSSYHSAAIAANFFRNTVHIQAQSYYAGEISILENFDVYPDILYIFISQSGETSDTNIALEKIKNKTDKTLSVTNTKNSTLYKNTKYKILTFAGIEKSIASTKAMSSQIFCLLLIALKIMKENRIENYDVLSQIIRVPDYIENAYTKQEEAKKYAQLLSRNENAVILASGMFYPLAKEGALKIKETSYINTTAYPTGEFLHGHIAILNRKCTLIALVNNSNVDFTMNVLEKVNSGYKTQSLIISAIPIDDTLKNTVITISTKNDIDFMFSALVIMQLLAYETAFKLGRNVDKPNGLSKIVK